MKVLSLRCAQSHTFEGWFASGEAFETQLASGLVECPMCGDHVITKLLSAPRLNLGASRNESSRSDNAKQDPVPSASNTLQQAQAAWLKMARHVMANTEDVGDRFADEARRIHYGETEERGIRGQATRAQTEELIDEGIAVLPLPASAAFKETLQ
jgi:hypothetical protein